MTSKIGVRQAVFEKLRLLIFHWTEVVQGMIRSFIVSSGSKDGNQRTLGVVISGLSVVLEYKLSEVSGVRTGY